MRQFFPSLSWEVSREKGAGMQNRTRGLFRCGIRSMCGIRTKAVMKENPLRTFSIP